MESRWREKGKPGPTASRTHCVRGEREKRQEATRFLDSEGDGEEPVWRGDHAARVSADRKKVEKQR